MNRPLDFDLFSSRPSTDREHQYVLYQVARQQAADGNANDAALGAKVEGA